jgi:CRP-like cAMP-binding protein
LVEFVSMSQATINAVVDAIIQIIAAARNIQLYPPSSQLIVNSLGKAHDKLTLALESGNAVILSESEGELLVNGVPLDEKNRVKPQIHSFLQVLRQFGLRSLTFQPGATPEELRCLLDHFSRTDAADAGKEQLQAVFDQHGVSHIEPDQKIFEVVDKDKQIVTKLNLTDDELVRFLVDGEESDAVDFEKAKELAKDPAWVSRVVRTGLTHLVEHRGAEPDALSEGFGHMLDTLSAITSADAKHALARSLADAIRTLDDESIAAVLIRHSEKVLGSDFGQALSETLDDAQFDRLARRLDRLRRSDPGPGGAKRPAEKTASPAAGGAGSSSTGAPQDRPAPGSSAAQPPGPGTRSVGSGAAGGSPAPTSDREARPAPQRAAAPGKAGPGPTAGTPAAGTADAAAMPPSGSGSGPGTGPAQPAGGPFPHHEGAAATPTGTATGAGDAGGDSNIARGGGPPPTAQTPGPPASSPHTDGGSGPAGASRPAGGSSGETQADANRAAGVFDALMQTAQGQRWQAGSEDREQQRRERRDHVKKGINRLMKGDPGPLRDRLVMAAVPKTIERLISRGHERTAETLFNRLLPGLKTQAPAHCETIALVIVRCIPIMGGQLKAEDLDQVSTALLKWLLAGAASAEKLAYAADQLQAMAQGYLSARLWAPATPILNTFRILAGADRAGHPLHAQAADRLAACPGPVTVPRLITALSSGGSQSRQIAQRCLVALDAASVPHLLQRLKLAADSAERTLLIDILSQVGTATLPMIREELKVKQKWFFIRNMLIVMGRFGSPSDLPLIQPFLTHPELQVQREALNAVVAIGGDQRREVLSGVVDQMDERLQEEAGKMLSALPAVTLDAPAQPQPPPESSPATAPSPSAQRGDAIDRLVAAGRTDEAVKQLYDRIVKLARSKRFAEAEKLRDRLMDVDPMALTEIVNSGDLIEAEKKQGIDPDHIAQWAALYDPLSAEETNTLFYSLKQGRIDADEVLFEQAQLAGRLFFIDAGELKRVYRQNEREVLLDQLEAGSVCGADSFFSTALETTSVISLAPVSYHYLEQSALDRWVADCPALITKLKHFCQQQTDPHELIVSKGEERRQLARVSLGGTADIQLISAKNQPVGKRFRAQLSDISAGGLAMVIKSAREKSARLLLGRRLRIRFTLNLGETPDPIDQMGKVVAVQFQWHNDYGLHVAFEGRLDDSLMSRLVAEPPPDAAT